MRCPTLRQLPFPPSGKTGWPWTEASPPLAETMPNGSAWPRLSIITPSYHQGQYLEETIRSVLLQGYPNLEYLIIDGGSTDESVEIIRNYEPWLTYWVSEPDRGQAQAINKGFARATGEVLGWINSDDILLPRALFYLAGAFAKHPRSILLGDVINFNQRYNYRRLIRQHDVTFERLIEPWRHEADLFWHQPGTYVPVHWYKQVGILNEDLRYLFDLDWMCRLLQVASVHYLKIPVAQFRLHGESKTIGESVRWYNEKKVIVDCYGHQVSSFQQGISYAALEAGVASTYLRLHNWDRHLGLINLWKAIQYDWRAVMLPGFMQLCFRAAMPVFLLKSGRALHHLWLRNFRYVNGVMI